MLLCQWRVVLGLCEICPSQSRQLMAYPGNQAGQCEILVGGAAGAR